MPLDLNNLNVNTTVVSKQYVPKYFSSKLTGNSKGTKGLLTSFHDPVMINEGSMPTSVLSDFTILDRLRTFRNNNTETTKIPFNPLSAIAWNNMQKYDLPDTHKLCKFGTITSSGKTTHEAYLRLYVNSLILEEVTKPPTAKTPGSKSRSLIVCYQLFVFLKNDPNPNKYDLKPMAIVSHARSYTTQNVYGYEFTHTPLRRATAIAEDLANSGWDIDMTALSDYFTNYTLYNGICEAAREWNEDLDIILTNVFENDKLFNNGRASDVTLRLMRRLESYDVPLDSYRKIYACIKQYYTQENDATDLCKENLKLLLNNTLNNLENNKALLTCVPTPATPVPVPKKYNKEQRNAITTTEPLVLVQSGAGTGKSTVILGRIDWMIKSGVKPEDITVLSFTNAAADHIKEKNSQIHSMTIASMIHSIYELNYPEHRLSNLDTIINSLSIYSQHINDPQFEEEFRRMLWAVKKSDNDAFTRMNNFVEANFAKVMETLDIITQTSLELEIIICYQQIDVLKEPVAVQSKYLIIDEVQDNSIFEFIYTLKYVDKHKESLYIVGDGSQTLYEFRASNPKALNVLEGSGVFKTYQLEINYRSVPEILAFANVTLLRNIEANQYAQIWLRANSMKQMTPQSFIDTIQLNYRQMQRISEFHDQLPSLISHTVKKYIDDKLAKKEQVAFLAFRRDTINICQETLAQLYPTKKIVSIVPEKMYNTILLSNFVKDHWHQVKYVPTKSLATILYTALMKTLDDLIGGPQYAQTRGPAAKDYIRKYFDKEEKNIDMWADQYAKGQITQEEMLSNVRESMTNYEIDQNKIKQALLASHTNNNKLDDAKNADIVLSTIHSAKGLEFDNTVVIFKSDNNMNEEEKRMYYVAFTRAMNSEYILAYGTVKSPQIDADYHTILHELSNGNGATPIN